VDQFDEVFTMLDDEARERFLADLLAVPGRVVVTLRPEALAALAAYPDLSQLVTANTLLLGPMSDDELRRAIELPAAAAELSFEDGLVDTLVADTGTDLVRLACALRLLSEGRTFTLSAYSDVGGVARAMETFGERALAAVGDRAAATRLLDRLVNGTGRTAPRADEAQAAQTLRDHGVLSEHVDGVDLAHPSLRLGWPRLRALRDEARVERDLRDHLGRTAAAWAAGSADVYRGPRLVAALDWAAGHAKDLSPVEQD